MMVDDSFLVSSVEKAGMSPRAYWNFAEMLVDKTKLSAVSIHGEETISRFGRKRKMVLMLAIFWMSVMSMKITCIFGQK